MLQPIIRRPSRGTKGQSAGATSISPSSSRPSLVESMRSNCRLISRFTRWTFSVGTTSFLHYCSDGRPFSPENHSKSFVTNDFQSNHSHLIAEAPENGSTNLSNNNLKRFPVANYHVSGVSPAKQLISCCEMRGAQ
jgi:hypothetical protein